MGKDPRLEEVALLGDNQPTGVAVSKSGRIFVSFPRWDKNLAVPTCSEIKIGENREVTYVPFPDARWNSWKDEESPADKFVSIQSVFIDHFDRLWILDPGAAYFGPVIPGGPKLLLVDLKSNEIKEIYRFDLEMAPLNSYLNDIRIDAEGSHAYITDSNLGHLLTINLKTHQISKNLSSHPSTKAEKHVVPTVEGIEVRLEDGSVFEVHSDGIAVLNGFCYYHSVTGRKMYRIPVEILRDPSLSQEDKGKAVEFVGETGVPDGLVAHADHSLKGDLYSTNLETNGIDLITPDGRVVPLVKNDERLQWPDSLSATKDYIYVTASQVHLMPLFNKGVSKRDRPYGLYRAKL